MCLLRKIHPLYKRNRSSQFLTSFFFFFFWTWCLLEIWGSLQNEAPDQWYWWTGERQGDTAQKPGITSLFPEAGRVPLGLGGTLNNKQAPSRKVWGFSQSAVRCSALGCVWPPAPTVSPLFSLWCLGLQVPIRPSQRDWALSPVRGKPRHQTGVKVSFYYRLRSAAKEEGTARKKKKLLRAEIALGRRGDGAYLLSQRMPVVPR